MWKTKLKDLCRIPIIGAPMADHSGGRLAAAVTNAGGIGFIGGGHSLFSDEKMSKLESEIAIYRSLTTDPLYVGFIGHSSFQDSASVQRYERFLQVHEPKIVQFFAPSIIKNNVEMTKKQSNCLFWAQVGTIQDARDVLQAGADGLILQGSEAGGHGLRRELGNATLALVNNFVQKYAAPTIPVLAAGGIVDPRSMASFMLLGCDGVVMGTRLWASKEALGDLRHELARPGRTCDNIVRTTLFDAIQNRYSSTPWSPPYDSVGVVRNETYEHFKDSSDFFDDSYVAYYRKNNKNPKIGLVHAGEGIGLVDSIAPASEIVSSINKGAIEWIQSAPKRLIDSSTG